MIATAAAPARKSPGEAAVAIVIQRSSGKVGTGRLSMPFGAYSDQTGSHRAASLSASPDGIVAGIGMRYLA